MSATRGLSLKEQFANRCVHFRGVQYLKCSAGVELASVVKETEDVPPLGRLRRCWPCLASSNWLGATCEKRRLPTAQEIAAEVAEIEVAMTDPKNWTICRRDGGEEDS